MMAGAHLAQDGFVVNASVDNGPSSNVLLILLSLLYRHIVLFEIFVACKSLHCLLGQVSCTGAQNQC